MPLGTPALPPASPPAARPRHSSWEERLPNQSRELVSIAVFNPWHYRRAAHSTAPSPIIGQFSGRADARLGTRVVARPRPRWFGDIHRMNPQSNVTASTLALSTATMAPIAMRPCPASQNGAPTPYSP